MKLLRQVLLISVGLSWLSRADELRLDLGGAANLSLRLIQPGTFTRGSPPTDAGRSADETPHEVTLTQPFYVGIWPVTVGQFGRFAVETRYRTEAEIGTSGGFGWDGAQIVQKREFTWRNPGFPQNADHPVTLVTWNDAREFCRWLSRKSGRQLTLPTEAQWEFACRAGTTTAYPTGEDAAAADRWAWHKGNSGAATHPCGQKEANAWGLFDMGGNAWEWCEDWFGPYPPGPATDPLQTDPNLSDKPRRVLRGGSWLKDAAACRSAARFRNDPRSRNADNGFRVVTLTLETPLPSDLAAQGPDTAQTEQGPTHQPPNQLPAAPSPTAPSPPSEGFSFSGLLCPIAGIGFIILVALIAIAKMKGRGTGVAASPKTMPMSESAVGTTVRTRLVNDGFWIQATVPPGTPIAWRCEAGGKVHEATIAYQPGPQGQFVFIGQQPIKASALVAGTIGRVTQMPSGPPSGMTSIDRGFAAGSILDQINPRGDIPSAPSSADDYPPAY
ncbi:MAG: formylglycine-generating enzyme family protein [Verrucomicrobiales bacterium]